MFTPAKRTLPVFEDAAAEVAAAAEVLAEVETAAALVVVIAAGAVVAAAAEVAGAFVLLGLVSRGLVVLLEGLCLDDLCLGDLCFEDGWVSVLVCFVVGEWICAGLDLCMLE